MNCIRTKNKKTLEKMFIAPSAFEKKETVHICMACDDNYARHCAGTIASVRSNADSSYLKFYLLTKGLKPENEEKIRKTADSENSKIEFIKISKEDFSDCPVPKGRHFSLETYFRLKIASIFKDLDKILYLDCDLNVLGNIKELWDENIDDYSAAGVADICGAPHIEDLMEGEQYFNAGVLLINCKKWRENNIEEKLFKFIEEYPDRIEWVDQDVLNVTLKGSIKFLEFPWNCMYNPLCDAVSYIYKESDIKILHYVTSHKPWKSSLDYKYSDTYFYYLKKTPWRAYAVYNHVIITLKRRLGRLLRIFNFLKNAGVLKKICHNKKVLIWGASTFIEKLIKKENINTSNIVGIIDRDKSKQGQYIGRYRIYAPSDLKNLSFDLIVSAVVNNPTMETFIKEELKKQNLEKGVITNLFRG